MFNPRHLCRLHDLPQKLEHWDSSPLTPGTFDDFSDFSDFFFFSKFLDSHFKDPLSGLDLSEALEALQSPLKTSLDPRTLVSLHCSARAALKNI